MKKFFLSALTILSIASCSTEEATPEPIKNNDVFGHVYECYLMKSVVTGKDVAMVLEIKTNTTADYYRTEDKVKDYTSVKEITYKRYDKWFAADLGYGERAGEVSTGRIFFESSNGIPSLDFIRIR